MQRIALRAMVTLNIDRKVSVDSELSYSTVAKW